MNALEFNQSIVNYANRDWQSVATAVALAHRTETTDARISASAAIAASTRAVGRFDALHESDDLAALVRMLAAFQRVNANAAIKTDVVIIHANALEFVVANEVKQSSF